LRGADCAPTSSRPGPPCSVLFRGVQGPEKAALLKERPCAHCGRPFYPSYGRSGSKYCSPDCYHTASRRYPCSEEAKRAEYNRRRAAKFAADFEEFSAVEIFERDSWRCGICGGRVNPRRKFPHKMSASLDHS